MKIGSSKASWRRWRRSRRQALALRAGDPVAARSLLKRRAALKGIELWGWDWRLERANAARTRYRERRKQEAAGAAAKEQRDRLVRALMSPVTRL